MSLYTQPTFEEIRRLFPEQRAAISLYINFEKPMSAAEKKTKTLAKLKGILRALPKQFFLNSEERQLFELSLYSAIENKLNDLGGYGQSYAIFGCDNFVLAYDVPNRLINHSEVSHNFFIQPILRSFAFSYEGYLLIVEKDNWELYYGSNVEQTVKVDLDKNGVRSLLEAVNKLNDVGHQITNNKKELMKDSTSLYVKRILEKLNGLIKDKEIVIVADKGLLAEFKNQMGSNKNKPILVTHRIPLTAPLYEIDHLLRSQLAIKHEEDLRGLFAELEKMYSKGLLLTDLSDIAMAAMSGRVDKLILPYTAKAQGYMDSETGKIDFTKDGDLLHSFVIAVAEHKGTILAFREDEINGELNGYKIAAILRF